MILNIFLMEIHSPSNYEERGHIPRPARPTIPPPTKK
jgi:hypothetical protein